MPKARLKQTARADPEKAASKITSRNASGSLSKAKKVTFGPNTKPRPSSDDAAENESDVSNQESIGIRKKRRRWRNGTVALRNIRSIQKADKVVFRKAPLRRIITTIARQQCLLLGFGPVNLSPGGLDAIKQYLTEEMTDIMRLANFLSVHARRVRVSKEDVVRSFNLAHCAHRLRTHNDQMLKGLQLQMTDDLAYRGEEIVKKDAKSDTALNSLVSDDEDEDEDGY